MEVNTSILSETDIQDLTPIQKFYTGCNIFVTGGTGFLGKMLLHKLFTACPGIDTLYLLVRNKKGKDVHSRVEEIFDDPMFATMKQKMPKFRHHIQGIPGDLLLPGLGISSADRQMLCQKVHIVFHIAATVRFDEKLKIAMQLNVQSCKEILLLCSQMMNLKCMMHISTAYTQCPLKKIDEKFYPPPMDSGKMLVLTECTTEKLLDNITPILLDKWPNTYTFTKAIAEDVVRQHGNGMPVGMFRPGIVISTYKDPVSGWIENFYGPTGAIAGAGTGVLRTTRCDPKAEANMVPVDLCVAGLIASAWDVHERYNKRLSNKIEKQRHQNEDEIPIYNFCTSNENKLTWGEFTKKTTKYGLQYPTIKAIWYLCYSNNSNKFVHLLSILLLHYVPAVIFDTAALIIGKKPRLLSTYKKIHKFMNVIEYFSMRQWEFQMDNVNSLWTKLCPKDKELFFFSMKELNWEYFFSNYYVGIRTYLLNDPLETVPKALVRWNRLYWLHQSVKVFVSVIILRLLWSVVSIFF